MDVGGEAPVLEQLRQMPHRDTYRGARRVSLFDGDARGRFFEDMAASLAETGELDLWTVELAGRPIAYPLRLAHGAEALRLTSPITTRPIPRALRGRYCCCA
jgi:hypothetical protein